MPWADIMYLVKSTSSSVAFAITIKENFLSTYQKTNTNAGFAKQAAMTFADLSGDLALVMN